MPRKADFANLPGLVDTHQIALALLRRREVKQELDEAVPLASGVSPSPRSSKSTAVPHHLVVTQHVRTPFAADNFAMHTDDQHFFAIRSVKEPVRLR